MNILLKPHFITTLNQGVMIMINDYKDTGFANQLANMPNDPACIMQTADCPKCSSKVIYDKRIPRKVVCDKCKTFVLLVDPENKIPRMDCPHCKKETSYFDVPGFEVKCDHCQKFIKRIEGVMDVECRHCGRVQKVKMHIPGVKTCKKCYKIIGEVKKLDDEEIIEN